MKNTSSLGWFRLSLTCAVAMGLGWGLNACSSDDSNSAGSGGSGASAGTPSGGASSSGGQHASGGQRASGGTASSSGGAPAGGHGGLSGGHGGVAGGTASGGGQLGNAGHGGAGAPGSGGATGGVSHEAGAGGAGTENAGAGQGGAGEAGSPGELGGAGSGNAGAAGSDNAGGQGGNGPPVTMADVQPIFDDRCVNCHDATKRGLPNYPDLPLTSDAAYSALVNRAAIEGCGTLVVPGNLEQSYLYQKLTSPTPCEGQQMPRPYEVGPFVPLTEQQLATIRAWISGGALQ